MRRKNNNNYGEIERFIDSYRKCNDGRSPSVREIGIAVGISPASVVRYMRDMKDAGIIEYNGHRNIKTQTAMKENSDMVSVPVLGRVSCGLPKFAEENIEEYVMLPSAIFGCTESYILRANGDSMIDAGINDGDLVLISRQNSADINQIVVALVGDEATLKRLKSKDGHLVLHPENENYSDIEFSEGMIQGVARMIIKSIG